MAERATADRVAADMKPPNYRGAVQRLRGIKPKKEKIAGINGEISGIYDTVEGFKVNKKAARIFLTLDPLEADERTDIWRSLVGLIDASGWDQGDLVDQAEGGAGNIVTPNFGGRKPAAAPENAAGEDTGLAATLDAIDAESGTAAAPEAEAPAAEPPAKKPRAGRLSPAEAREKAKAHFESGTAPPPTGEAAPEAYTGDNSDLAGDA